MAFQMDIIPLKQQQKHVWLFCFIIFLRYYIIMIKVKKWCPLSALSIMWMGYARSW